MRKLISKKLWHLPMVAIIALSLLTAGGGIALASGFILDQTVPATVTVEYPAISVDLYTDLECTTLWDGTMDFGTLTEVGQTATQMLYFKANKSHSVPGGYGFGEIDPDTIVVTDNINEAVATSTYVVGEPFGAVINGNHPCMITFSVTAVGEGTTNFDITVTGTS